MPWHRTQSSLSTVWEHHCHRPTDLQLESEERWTKVKDGGNYFLYYYFINPWGNYSNEVQGTFPGPWITFSIPSSLISEQNNIRTHTRIYTHVWYTHTYAYTHTVIHEAHFNWVQSSGGFKKLSYFGFYLEAWWDKKYNSIKINLILSKYLKAF